LVGGVLLVAAMLRLGVVASFISEPVLVGFKAGVGLTIVVDQIPKLLGVQFAKGHFFRNLVAIVDHLPHASVPTVVLALGLLALQLSLQQLLPRVPASLVTVATGIALSALAGLKSHGIALVGDVKGGLPSFAVPSLSLVEELWPAALGIALMSFVETIAAGQAFREPSEPRPEPNKELVAIGLTNLIGGAFHNQPSGGGTSQTAVNRRAGARTQISGLVTAAVVVGVLFFLAPIIRLMPQAALAVVVVVPCVGMIKLPEFSAITAEPRHGV
jgi:MFS superfamily sulfate permease-like transporter